MKTLLPLLAALLCNCAALADVARPVLQSSTTKALVDDLATGAKKMTISSTGTLEWVNGGTMSGASYFRTAAGLAIGTNVQAYDADLTTIAALAHAAGVLTDNGSGVYSYTATSTGGNGSDDSGKLARFNATGQIAGGFVGTLEAGPSYDFVGIGEGLYIGSETNSGRFGVPVAGGTSLVWTLPSVTGTLVSTGDTGSVTNTMLAGSIALTKLLQSSATSGQVIAWNGTAWAPATISSSLAIGTTVISGGTSDYILYNNAGFVGNLATTGSGSVVRAGSPALTGTPTAPTASAANNSTQVATTAYADGAVAVLSASLQAAMAKANAASVWTVSWYIQDATTSGSASTSATMMGVQIATGSTAGSNARVLPNPYGWAPWWLDPSVTNPVTSPRWNKPFVMSFSVSPVARTAGGTFWCKFSGAYSDDGDLSYRGVGIKVTGSTMVGIYHNGTTGGSTATLVTFGFNDDVRHVAIVSDGAGNITWIVDGTAAATTSAGPATLETTAYLNKGNWSVEATNGADAAQYIWNISPISSQWNK